MKFQGEMRISLPPEKVWAKITDVRFILSCLPDVETVVEASEERGTCKVKPGFSFVRGTLETTIERLDIEPQHRASFRMTSRGVGSSTETVSRLELEPSEHGTLIRWQAEVTQLGGLLKALPQGLIRGTAQKTIEDTWENVKRKLSADGSGG